MESNNPPQMMQMKILIFEILRLSFPHRKETTKEKSPVGFIRRLEFKFDPEKKFTF